MREQSTRKQCTCDLSTRDIVRMTWQAQKNITLTPALDDTLLLYFWYYDENIIDQIFILAYDLFPY